MGFLDNLQAGWNFNEDYLDQSGNVNTLTPVNSPVFVEGKIDEGLLLVEASNKYAKITDGDQTGLDITGAITISCWVYFNSIPEDGVRLVTKWRGDIHERSFLFDLIFSGGNHTVRGFITASGDGSGAQQAFGSTNIEAGQWYNFILVYDPSTSIKVYVNNSEDGSNTSSIPGSIYNSNSEVRVGGEDEDGSATSIDGIIDAVYIWDKVATSDERDFIYNDGNGRETPFTARSDAEVTYDYIESALSKDADIIYDYIESVLSKDADIVYDYIVSALFKDAELTYDYLKIISKISEIAYDYLGEVSQDGIAVYGYAGAVQSDAELSYDYNNELHLDTEITYDYIEDWPEDIKVILHPFSQDAVIATWIYDKLPVGYDGDLFFDIYRNGALYRKNVKPQDMLRAVIGGLQQDEKIAIDVVAKPFTWMRKVFDYSGVGDKVFLTWVGSPSADVVAYRIYWDEGQGGTPDTLLDTVPVDNQFDFV